MVRASARRCGISSVIEEQAVVKLRMPEIDYLIWQQLSDQFRGRLRLGAGDTPSVNVKKQSGDNVPELLLKLFEKYEKIQKEVDEANAASSAKEKI